MRSAILILLFALAGCATAPDPADGATFVLVRHAEKAPDGSADPPLTEAGGKRAERLAWSLQNRPLVAVYASPTRRAQATAAPAARAHALTVTSYDPAQPPAALARELRERHRAGTVLVVGHSNTIPGLAQAFCGCAIGPIADSEYGRRISLRVAPDGRVTVDDRREP